MKFKRIESVIIMMLGFLVMFFGIARGETDTVLEKAIRICLECIGVG